MSVGLVALTQLGHQSAVFNEVPLNSSANCMVHEPGMPIGCGPEAEVAVGVGVGPTGVGVEVGCEPVATNVKSSQ